MARKPRKLGETGIYHVILRGNNQELIFYDDKDRQFFLSKLNKYILELHLDLYSYCLMDNHVHLLIGKASSKMALFVKKIACSYVYYFNHKYNRTGHLFQGRYKSEPVETVEYLKTVYRYILQNPEKAGLCNFRHYKWSSVNCQNDGLQTVNTDFIVSVFTSKTEMHQFLSTENTDLCMENVTFITSDDELKSQLITSIFKLNSPLELQNYSQDNLKSNLAFLKHIGFSINQISRISGINKKIIQNA